MIRRLGLVLLVAGLAFLGYMSVKQRVTRTKGPAAATAAAPDISLIDLDGTSFNTSNFRGKVLVVNFWAAWCAPCTVEIPQFVTLQEKYRQQGLQVLGISMDDADDVLRKFYPEHKMNYPVVAGDLKSADAFGGVPGLPTTYIYARDGRLKTRIVGATDFSSLEKEVVALLQAGGR
ncbi:MAG TPA: TlpA disulfide reductase family protein [Candidatus Angelobacter sp.]